MNTKIDLQPVRDQIEEIEETLLSPLPTPPIGTPVVWYDRAEIEDARKIAGLVTKVEGPGKVTLTVFRPQGMPDPTRRGCLHVSHPVHQERANAVSKNSGAWDYVEVENAKDWHFDLHREQLNEKRQRMLNKLATAEHISAKSQEKKPRKNKSTTQTTSKPAAEEAIS